MSQRNVLGGAPGQPQLRASGPGVALAPASNAIPELEASAEKPRSIWRHPAFLVSMILTVLALIAAGVLIVWSLLAGGGGAVSNPEISVEGGNAHVSWSSDGPVDLYVVTGDDVLDVSQLIVGDEAWVPAALGFYESTSCFVIRPASESAQDVTLDSDALAAQRGASACVRDAAGG